MKHLEAKWIRKDGWKARQFVCAHSAGPIKLTLYFDPQQVEEQRSHQPRVHKGYTRDQGL